MREDAAVGAGRMRRGPLWGPPAPASWRFPERPGPCRNDGMPEGPASEVFKVLSVRPLYFPVEADVLRPGSTV